MVAPLCGRHPHVLQQLDASTPTIAFLCGLSCSTWLALQSRQKLSGCEPGSESFFPATSPARHLAPISMGGTHNLPTQTLRIQPGPWRFAPSSHPADSCGMGQTPASSQAMPLATSCNNLQDAWPVCWECLSLVVPCPVPAPDLSNQSRVQTTLMIEALNLYVPVLTDDEALHNLLRLRRHLVKRWTNIGGDIVSPNFLRVPFAESLLGHIFRQEFQSNRPAKVMLHHLIAQHSHKLNRPGPWNTPHSLVRKFWYAMELEGDYIHVATDRDVWKSLSESFLQWHGFTRTQNNVEMLEQNPWDKPKRLLHIPVAWIHLVFVGIQAGVFTAVWLDTVAGFSVWADSEPLQGYEANITRGFRGLCYHLNMLGGPFLLQIAVPNAAVWRAIQNHATPIQQTLQQSNHASWYQLFPLTASERQHRSLRHCLTYVT